MSTIRDEIAYLRRYQDACATLAEMAMTAKHSFNGQRFVVWYDDDESEYVVARQWYGDDGGLIENEMVRSGQFADAVERAYDIEREGRS